MKTKGNDPISPCKGHDREFMDKMHSGLSKREYFAAMAMQGLWQSTTDMDYDDFDKIAEMAVNQADALIEALNKEEK